MSYSVFPSTACLQDAAQSTAAAAISGHHSQTAPRLLTVTPTTGAEFFTVDDMMHCGPFDTELPEPATAAVINDRDGSGTVTLNTMTQYTLTGARCALIIADPAAWGLIREADGRPAVAVPPHPHPLAAALAEIAGPVIEAGAPLTVIETTEDRCRGWEAAALAEMAPADDDDEMLPHAVAVLTENYLMVYYDRLAGREPFIMYLDDDGNAVMRYADIPAFAHWLDAVADGSFFGPHCPVEGDMPVTIWEIELWTGNRPTPDDLDALTPEGLDRRREQLKREKKAQAAAEEQRLEDESKARADQYQEELRRLARTNRATGHVVINAADWADTEPPEREWAWEGRIPRRKVTGVYGDGGLGKSLLALMTSTAIVTGIPLFGANVTKGRVLCLFCEDDADELHRRQLAICKALNVNIADLEGLDIISGEGLDNVLLEVDGGKVEETKFYQWLLRRARAHRADFIVVDTAADTFGGNENDRQQVRRYIQRCLGGLSRQLGATVLLLAHPSRDGLRSGRGDGGNTGWNNAFRARLYLRDLDPASRDPEERMMAKRLGSDGRVLETMKANYSKRGGRIFLRWANGVFHHVSTMAVAADRQELDARAEQVFLAALDYAAGQQIRLSDAKQATASYAPRWMVTAEQNDGIDETDLAAAMVRLQAAGQIQFGVTLPWRQNRKIIAGIARTQCGINNPTENNQ